MKKRTKIIAAVVAILAIIAAACVYGYVSGKPEPAPDNPAVQPDDQQPTTPDKPTDDPVQPDNPNPTGGESVIVYVPDESGETLTPVGAEAADDSDQALVDALIAAGSLPEGVKVQSSSTADGVLTLDMNAAYGEAVRSSGTAGEDLLVYALVNTFAQARGVDSVLLTVDGAPLESGHEIYDYPIEASLS